MHRTFFLPLQEQQVTVQDGELRGNTLRKGPSGSLQGACSLFCSLII
ncbi:hypothetical protein [Paraflavitalea soli]|nr:hypothetical protein [Paraflavitalea soli]